VSACLVVAGGWGGKAAESMWMSQSANGETGVVDVVDMVSADCGRPKGSACRIERTLMLDERETGGEVLVPDDTLSPLHVLPPASIVDHRIPVTLSFPLIPLLVFIVLITVHTVVRSNYIFPRFSTARSPTLQYHPILQSYERPTRECLI
jgi:hypothetical protein